MLTPELAEGLAAYYELLGRWNRKINLTSITRTDEAIDRLLIEPVLAAKHVPAEARSLIDIGSGGGSPAIPFKLAVPALSLRMVESKARKSAFLREAVRHLGLKSTVVDTNRYEELLTRPELHESSDIISLRAVRIEARVFMGLQAFLRPGRWFFLFCTSAGAAALAQHVPPPLTPVATHTLLEPLHSQLVVIEKRPVGRPRSSR